jgi:hypothetical protein
MHPGWKAETLATAAGILRRDYPDVSTYYIVRVVYRIAELETGTQGLDQLLHRARKTIETARERGMFHTPRFSKNTVQMRQAGGDPTIPH